VRIVDIRERSVPISRYLDPGLPSGGLTTSIVALVTDVVRSGRPVVGLGFASMGRFAQSGLIRERFAPRLLGADLATAAGTNLDPFRAWELMLRPEKPGGHGERCVAVGTLDMALWDAAAKIADLPLSQFLRDRLALPGPAADRVRVYAGGGYLYPRDDLRCLEAEARSHLASGYSRVKVKIGATDLAADLRRIERVLALLPDARSLAVDAMNSYSPEQSLAAAKALAPYGLGWFEDICDPLDLDTHAAVAAAYPHPLAAGEALFSLAEAKLLHRFGGLRPDRDILLFDPVHCYGVPGYLQILDFCLDHGWPRAAFWPHGGHLFCLHLVAALGLGGAEVNPLAFQPFGGLPDGVHPDDGWVAPPQSPGIGFERRAELATLFRTLLD
jgi:D(-)-tartrate dehydratase